MHLHDAPKDLTRTISRTGTSNTPVQGIFTVKTPVMLRPNPQMREVAKQAAAQYREALMPAGSRRCFCAFLLLLPLIAWAEPADVLVGDLVFSRPESWKWAAPANGSAATNRFIVAPDTDLKPGTEVRFYITDRKPKSSIAGWKSYFPDPTDREKAQEERVTVRGRKVVWFTIRGHYVFPKTPPKRDYLFVAVMISHGEQFIMVRLSGPESDSGPALPKFRNMVNDALTNAPEGTENQN